MKKLNAASDITERKHGTYAHKPDAKNESKCFGHAPLGIALDPATSENDKTIDLSEVVL
jgi:hypothetical protein